MAGRTVGTHGGQQILRGPYTLGMTRGELDNAAHAMGAHERKAEEAGASGGTASSGSACDNCLPGFRTQMTPEGSSKYQEIESAQNSLPAHRS